MLTGDGFPTGDMDATVATLADEQAAYLQAAVWDLVQTLNDCDPDLVEDRRVYLDGGRFESGR